jgi:hypothetical protein
MTESVAFKAKTAATKEVKVPEGLTEIERLTREYAEARSALAATATQCATEMAAIKTSYLAQLREQSAIVLVKHKELSSLISKSKKQFVSPRSAVFHGIKVGIQKLIGSLKFDDEAKTVELIRKHLPSLFDTLVTTKYTLNKDAIGTLKADELKKIGGSVTDSSDRVVIKPVQGDIEKIVKALLTEKKGK